MKYLFIGGIADGKFIDVPEEVPTWHIGQMTPLSNSYLSDKLSPVAETTITEYVRQQLVDNEGRNYFVYALPDLNIIRTLLAGYRETGLSRN